MRALLLLGFVALSGCDEASSSAPPSTSIPTPEGGAPVASKCAATTGPGTTHAAVTATETWTAAGSPHVVTTAISIAAGVTLTLEPCAVVKLPEVSGILVEGRLVAEGAEGAPIRIERGGAAAWGSIETRAGAELRLAYTTLEGGGNPNGGRLTQAATVDLRGDQDLAPQPIFFADHVTIDGSASLGVWAREGGGFAPGSKELVIKGGASFPILSWTRAAGSLPPGTYTGNATDEIMLQAAGTRDSVRDDMTLFARGVPYRVGGDTAGTSFTVSDEKKPLLTIEPGVTLKFAKETRLFIERGALLAEGTPAAPIVFTSAEATPLPGDWPGILIGQEVDSRNRISHATVAYAGGITGVSSYGCPSPAASSFSNEGAIVIYGDTPSSAFVKDTTIQDSAADGIVRGWTGDDIDFLPTNSFTGVARCQQTSPKPVTGPCPTTCPR